MKYNSFLSPKFQNDLLSFFLDVFDNVNRKIILPNFQNLKSTDIKHKIEKNDLVTLVDIKTEAFITEEISKKFSKINIVGEESTFSNSIDLKSLNDDYFFTVDPIDGTNNYVKGNEKFCSMISLVYNKIPKAAFIFFPLSNKLIYSFSGEGVFFYESIYNNSPKKIFIKNTSSSFIGTGNTKGIPELVRNRMLDRLKKYTKRDFIGSAGVETLKMLLNRVNFILHGRVTPWDHYPLDLLIREAGGEVYMIRDKTKFIYDSYGPLLATSNITIWNELSDLILPKVDSYRIN